MSTRKRKSRGFKKTATKRHESKWSKMTDEEKKLENSLSFTTKNKTSLWKDNNPLPIRTLTKTEIACLYPKGRI